MANTCYNYLTIASESSDEILTNILNEDGDVDFDILLPLPENVTELHNPIECTPYQGERDWSCYNIGCPGIPETVDVEELENGEVFITFETQWSEPNTWFNKLGETVSNLTKHQEEVTTMCLEYNEHDMCFAGKLDYIAEPTDGGSYYVRTDFRGQQLADELGLNLDELPSYNEY